MSDNMPARDLLRSIIERIERLEEEKKTIADDIKDVKTEAKSQGLSVAVINEILKLRKMDPNERAEKEALLDMYRFALGMLPLEEYAARDATAAPIDREVRRKQRTSEAMDDNKALSKELLDAGLISEYAYAENIRLSDGVARIFGAGVVDPETGEILESVQSHEAAVVIAPAESASGEISATNQPETAKDSPHHLVPTRGDDAAMASSQQEGATGRQPVDTLRAGRTGSITVTAGETASISNPQASSSRQADKAETAPPVVSAAFTNPKCLKPKTCPNAHSKTACFDCVMEYGKRPPEEQKRLWAEAIGGRDAA